MQWIETLNVWSLTWADWMITSTVETTIVFAVAGTIWIVGRRWISAPAGYWLFALVLLKAILPLHVSVPAQWAAWSQPHGIAEWLQPPELCPVDFPATNTPTPAIIVDTRGPQIAAELTTDETRDMTLYATATRVPMAASFAQGTASQAVVRFSWTAEALLGWLAIMVVLLAGLARGHFRLLRMLRQAESLLPSSVGIDWGDLTGRSGVRRPVRVLSSALVGAPAVAGLLRPTLLLPVGLECRMTPAQWSWVVLHELAHIRRGDLWVATAQRIVTILFFFHPVVWLASWLVDQQRECACDDEALVASGCPTHECAAAFLMIVDRAGRTPRSSTPLLAMSAGHADIKRRMLRLLDSRRPIRPRLSWSAVIGLGLLAGLVLPRVSASQPEGGTEAQVQQTNAGPPADALGKLNDGELQQHFARIWRDQMREIRSAKVRVWQLWLSAWDDKDRLQQGRALASLNHDEVSALLNRVDLVKNPDRLREVRDELLSGRLILDQPVYHVLNFAMDGTKARFDWECGDSLICDGENSVALEPANHQAIVCKGTWPQFSHQHWPLSRGGYVPQNFVNQELRTIPILYGFGSPDISRLGGRYDFEFKRQSSSSSPAMFVGWFDGATVDRDGFMDRMSSRTSANRVMRETVQLGHTTYPGNVRFPKVHITAEYSVAGPLTGIAISIIEQASFNEELPPATFVASVPGNTAVWDKRNGLKLRAAEQPVDDVLSLFEK
jgi:beta-lactamase regulating signal transducer with metallopeptidase domain